MNSVSLWEADLTITGFAAWFVALATFGNDDNAMRKRR